MQQQSPFQPSMAQTGDRQASNLILCAHFIISLRLSPFKPVQSDMSISSASFEEESMKLPMKKFTLQRHSLSTSTA
jgi:hypothetical protein